LSIQLHSRPLIIHVINDLSAGGAELLLINTIKILPDYEHIVVYLFTGKELAENFNEQNVELICLKHKGWRSIFSSARKLRTIIKKRRPALVHSHLFDSTICARLAVPASIPLVSTLHSLYSKDAFEKSKKSVWAEKFTLRRRHNIIGVSKYVLNDYLKFIPFNGERFVLYNFLPDNFFDLRQSTSSAGHLKCITIGNLKEVKNYNYLLEIFSNFQDKNITLDIYGEGNLRNELQEKIDKLGLPVFLRGFAPDTRALFKNYDLFIQASLHEGFGLSVIEAMASGMPVFLSDIPVFHEISNDLAHFFPLQDSRTAAQLLQCLKDNEQKRNQYIEKAYDHCKKSFNEQTYKNKLLEIYSHILSKH
jgi:glycosyltransferase involved in cell wall biosynthesis